MPRPLILILLAALAGGATPALAPAQKLPERATRADVKRFAAESKGGLAKCAEEQRRRDPKVHGTLALSWWVEPDGNVYTVTTTNSALAHAAVTYYECATLVIREWGWPKAQKRSEVFTHTFTF